MPKTLIMIPTYQEADNIQSLVERLVKLQLDADILFIDDNSPDGTGKLLDECALKYKRIKVLHRRYKSGIGTAHQYGIQMAYVDNYTRLITMDGDFTHPPENISALLKYADDYDIVIGGRHAQKSSLEGWAPWRKILTYTAHAFTSTMLYLPYDATSAFRIYNIEKIPERTFKLIHSKSYSFFFESLCILNENKFTIYDVPVVLPPRTLGSSKLKFKDMAYSLFLVLKLGLRIRIHDKKLYIETP